MGNGFKKEFMGYNKQEVCNYISVLSQENEKALQDLREEITTLRNENAEIKAKLGEYENRAESIEKLSKAIGRLYVISKANADAVNAESDKIKKRCREEERLSSEYVDSIEKLLRSAEDELKNLSEQAANKIDELTESLNSCREKNPTHTLKTN